MIITGFQGEYEGAKVSVTGGFSPGSGQLGVSKAFIARDAADFLLPGSPSEDHPEASGRGVLSAVERMSRTCHGAPRC